MYTLATSLSNGLVFGSLAASLYASSSCVFLLFGAGLAACLSQLCLLKHKPAASAAGNRVNQSGESDKTLKYELKEAKLLDKLDCTYLSHCKHLLQL